MTHLFRSRLILATFLFRLATNDAFTINPLNKRSLLAVGTQILSMYPTEGSEDDVNDNCTMSIDTNTKEISVSRRLISSQVFATFTGFGTLFYLPRLALAGIDVSSLRSLPVDGDASGAATRLRNLQMQGVKIERGGDVNFTVMPTRLDSGVTYRDIKTGRDGARTVRRGSNVGAEMTVRCKSFATPNEPDGAKYFSTTEDNDSNEISWTVGSGYFPRGLEEGMMGMKLNAVRRIEVPSQQMFAARNAGQLPEPTTEEGKRLYASAFQSGDATFVFEVYITGINQGDNRI